MEGSFVVTGSVPGFREGTVVNLNRRWVGGKLTDADMEVLRLYASQLVPICPPEAGQPTPEMPPVPHAAD